MNKARSQFKHAMKRATERYGVNLSESDYWNIRNLVLTNRTRKLGRRSNRTSKHIVSYHGVDYKIIYDTTRHTIVTFLP